jgi:hypothetical protein
MASIRGLRKAQSPTSSSRIGIVNLTQSVSRRSCNPGLGGYQLRWIFWFSFCSVRWDDQSFDSICSKEEPDAGKALVYLHCESFSLTFLRGEEALKQLGD